MLLKHLRSRILVLLLTSIGGSMLLAGVTLGYFISQQFEDEAKSNFGKFHHDAKSTLSNLQNLYQTDATILASNTNVIASLNLISEG